MRSLNVNALSCEVMTNPIVRLQIKPTYSNAIKAKCAECMGCTETRLERGFRDAIRACSSWDCPLHAFRPYRVISATKPLKNGQLETAGAQHEPPGR